MSVEIVLAFFMSEAVKGLPSSYFEPIQSTARSDQESEEKEAGLSIATVKDLSQI